MTQKSEVSMPFAAGANQTACSNCHSVMPSDLRFCRNCGFRLVDGMGGYTGIQANESAAFSSAPQKKKRRIGGISWIFIALLVFFVGAAAFTALVAPIRQGRGFVSAPAVKSYLGVDEFFDTDDGVVLNSVSVPGGPADKAGLVGGDIFLSFDGTPVKSEDDMKDMMVKTPVGKTVAVEYIRDGEKKETQLTTISLDDYRRIEKEFQRRPEGRGRLGYDEDDVERMRVPGMNIYGVRVDSVSRSLPADLAGVKARDILIEFDGAPIRTTDELLMRVLRALPYSTVKVVVMRRTGEDESSPFEKVEIPVKMGKR